MGQTVAAKEGHERLGKRGESFIKGQQGGFAGKGIADQDGNKIDHVVLTKACAGEAHLFLDDFEDSLMGKNLSKGSHFSHPGRSRGLRFRGNLDRDRRMRHTTNVSSLFEKRSLIVFSQGDTFFARAPASLLFSYETSLRIPWAMVFQKTLIEHWNGKQWSIVPSPNVSGSTSDILNGVEEVSARNIWAVGVFFTRSAGGLPLIEHWNGVQWSIVPGAD